MLLEGFWKESKWSTIGVHCQNENINVISTVLTESHDETQIIKSCTSKNMKAELSWLPWKNNVLYLHFLFVFVFLCWNKSLHCCLFLLGLQKYLKIKKPFNVLPLKKEGRYKSSCKLTFQNPESPSSTPRRLFLSFTARHSATCLGCRSQPPPLDTNPYGLIDNENI